MHWELVPSSLWVSVVALAVAVTLFYGWQHVRRTRARQQREARRTRRRARQTAWEWVMRRPGTQRLTDQRARP
jgi:hypothetical protein